MYKVYTQSNFYFKKIHILIKDKIWYDFSTTKEFNIVSLPILRDLLSKILERNLINIDYPSVQDAKRKIWREKRIVNQLTSYTGVFVPRILKKSIVIIEERFSTGILFRFAISSRHFLTVTEFQGFNLFVFVL